jgi:long-chain acyl-CoA synthetase
MDKIWLKRYPPGTAAEISPEAIGPQQSLVTVMENSCQRFAERPAFYNWGTTLTYRELDERTRDFAAYLQSIGFSKGDRIAVMLPNLLQYPIAMFGALRAGLTVVNTNPLYTPRELEHQLKDSGATAIVILANFARTLEQVIAKTQVRHVIVTQLGDMLRFPKGVAINWAAQHLKHLVPRYNIPNAVKFKDAMDIGAHASFKRVAVEGDDLAYLQYTGGTTGIAKGAMLTHRNMVANLEQVSTLWASVIEDGKEIIITALPMYHIFCLTCNCLTFSKHGGLNVLITNPRDIPGFIAELQHWKFTIMSGVTTLYNALLEHPRFRTLDLSHFKFGAAGGMALTAGVAKRWHELTHKPLVEGFGLTEASPVVSCNLLTDSRVGTVGVPLPSTEISIRDEEREVAIGEEGELCVRGPQVMKGYLNMPEETKKAFLPDGWLRTGDIAKLDNDGFLHIVDRKKDMIIVSGFKVFPNEIESVVSMHSSVIEVGCVGVPDARSGQAVKVFVVIRETESVTVEQIREHCREHLTAYKVPKYVEFRPTLPKTNIGKILRRALLEEQVASSGDAPSTLAH